MYKNKIRTLLSKFTTDENIINHQVDKFTSTKYLKQHYTMLESREKETGPRHILAYITEDFNTKDLSEEEYFELTVINI